MFYELIELYQSPILQACKSNLHGQMLWRSSRDHFVAISFFIYDGVIIYIYTDVYLIIIYRKPMKFIRNADKR
jgi:hypothetical protein